MSNTSSNMTPEQYTEILIAEFLKTDDFKRVTNAFTHELLKKWAGESGIKKRLAPSIEKRMKKSLFGAENGDATDAALPASADPTTLAAPIVAMINDMLAKVDQMGDTLEDMPYEKKESLLETVIQNIDFRKMGALSGPIIRMMTAVYEKNPTFLSDHLKEGLTDWINNLEFTTLTENLTRSQDDIAALASAANDALWSDPDRLLRALEIIPAVINFTNKYLAEFLTRFSQLKIEEITDIFLHLLEKIDGEAMGTVLNANAHINRKIMRGTKELRDPLADIPTSENILMSKVEEIASKMDPNLIFNLRLNIEDLKVPLREWLMSDE